MKATSLGDILRQRTAEHPDRVAMYLPPGKGQEDFAPVSYGELGRRVRQHAAAIHGYGLQRGDRMAIFADNAADWAWADWACQCLGVVAVPIFSTLPADQAQYIVADSGATVALVGSEDFAKKLPGTRCEALKLADDAPEMDAGEWNAAIDQVQPDDLCTLIYTSGTTGQPKGVMLDHRAILNVIDVVPGEIDLGPTDIFFSFLPMSHVYERVAGQFLPIGVGASIAYAKNLASIADGLQKVKPTVMLCVPRFLEAFFDRVTDAVSKAPPIRQKLFRLAFEQGLKRTKGGFAPLAGILDKIVMAKVRERTGGRIRYFVSGGAALPPKVAEFYMALGLNVLQGYGLTETSGASVVNRPERNKYWTVGEPIGCEVKLAEDGEILLRGPSVMRGYYNLPDETAKAIDPEGWFHSGDIGEWEGKSLKITDRKKDILVLGNGKNIAPQPLENRLKESAYIQEAVVLGDGMDHCVALIVPNIDLVRKELGLPEDAKMSESDAAHALVKKEVDKFNKSVANFEMVKRFALVDAAFSIEGGELTPTLKVKRKAVREKYAAALAKLA